MRWFAARFGALHILVVSLCPYVPAQLDSRVAEIEAARQDKAQRLEPDEVSKGERILLYLKDKKVLERIAAGIAGFRVNPTGGIRCTFPIPTVPLV